MQRPHRLAYPPLLDFSGLLSDYRRMATLRAYVDGSGYYVRHSFAVGGRVLHVNYQTSDAAVRRLTGQGIRDGDSIPRGLLHELISAGELFTGGTGANPVEVDPVKSNESDELGISLDSLSEQARKWFSLMILCHPSVTALPVMSKSDNGFTVQFNALPENYLQQVLFVARRFDGTSFFENIRLSCKHLPPNASF